MRNGDKLGLLGAALLLAGSGAVLATHAGSIFNTGTGGHPGAVRVASLNRMADDTTMTDFTPATELLGFEPQLKINRRELEITNVHLGHTASAEITSIPDYGAPLARIAVDPPLTFQRPEPVARPMVGKDMIAAAPMQPDSPNRVKQDAIGTTQTAGNRPPVETGPILPTAPFGRDSAGFPFGSDLGKKANLTHSDNGMQVPMVSDLNDQSPFGVDCKVDLDAGSAPGAMVHLALNVPCLPNSRVEIRHGKLFFAAATDPVGKLDINVPALEEDASISVRLSTGTTLDANVKVPELKDFERVAVLWRGLLDLEIHALEFGANQNSRGHIWPGHPSEPEQARRQGGGFVITLGNETLPEPERAAIYSLPRSARNKAGVVKMILTANADAATCGTSQTVYSVHSKQGRMVGASGFQFEMPACGSETQSMVLNNAVRDLIIAAK
ncbi:MAG: hypothetical protein KDA67_13315 [Rhodobacteraceae bacterium]|nr:hypothetical protein [Paracoccaceae bacterium]